MSVPLEQFRKGDRLMVGLGKLSNQDKVQLIKKIVSVIDGSKKKYLIEIRGLGGTIDTFIKDIQSKNYLYINESKVWFIIKEFARLFLLTEIEQDLYSVTEYFGSFNEGYICVSVLKTCEDINVRESAIDQIEIFVRKHCILEILVEPDGDFLDIRAHNEIVTLSDISTAVSQFVL